MAKINVKQSIQSFENSKKKTTNSKNKNNIKNKQSPTKEKANKSVVKKRFFNIQDLRSQIYIGLFIAIVILAVRVFAGFESMKEMAILVGIGYFFLISMFLSVNFSKLSFYKKNLMTMCEDYLKIALAFSLLIIFFLFVSWGLGYVVDQPSFRDLTINPELNQ